MDYNIYCCICLKKFSGDMVVVSRTCETLHVVCSQQCYELWKTYSTVCCICGTEMDEYIEPVIVKKNSIDANRITVNGLTISHVLVTPQNFIPNTFRKIRGLARSILKLFMFYNYGVKQLDIYINDSLSFSITRQNAYGSMTHGHTESYLSEQRTIKYLLQLFSEYIRQNSTVNTIQNNVHNTAQHQDNVSVNSDSIESDTDSDISAVPGPSSLQN